MYTVHDFVEVYDFCCKLRDRFGIVFTTKPIYSGVCCLGEFYDLRGNLLTLVINAHTDRVDCSIYNFQRQQLLAREYKHVGLVKESYVTNFIHKLMYGR